MPLTAPSTWSTQFTEPIMLCTMITLLIMVLFSSSIIVHVIKEMSKRRRESYDDEPSQPVTHIVFLIYFELFIIFSVITCGLFAISFSSNQYDCTLIARIWFILFHGHRCILYFICVRRTMITYEDTIIPFNKIHEYIVYILIAIYFIIYLLMPLLLPSIPYINNVYSMSIQYDGEYGCLFEYEPPIFYQLSFQYTSSLFHILMIIYSLHIFISPLRALTNVPADHNCNVSSQLYLVIIKYCILHSCSIASAIVLIILCCVLPFGFNYSIIDAFINGMRLILLHPIHNTVYKYLCCIFHTFCRIYICKPSVMKKPKSPVKPSIKKKPEPEPKQAEPDVGLHAIDKEPPSEPKMRQLFKAKVEERMSSVRNVRNVAPNAKLKLKLNVNKPHFSDHDESSNVSDDDDYPEAVQAFRKAEEEILIRNGNEHNVRTPSLAFLYDIEMTSFHTQYQQSILSGVEMTEIDFSRKTTKMLKFLNMESEKL